MNTIERIQRAILVTPPADGSTEVEIADSSLGELAEIGWWFHRRCGMNWTATPYMRGRYVLKIRWTPEQWRRLNETTKRGTS